MTNGEMLIGALQILILGNLFFINRRLGCGDWMLKRLKELCPIFGKGVVNCGKKEEMG